LLDNPPLRLGEQIGCEKVPQLAVAEAGSGARVGQAWFDTIDAEDVGQPHPVQDAIASGLGIEAQ
jgi:hypothetical protein